MTKILHAACCNVKLKCNTERVIFLTMIDSIINNICKSRNLGRTELAKELGFTLSCVSNYVNGERQPSIKHAMAIVEYAKKHKIKPAITLEDIFKET